MITLLIILGIMFGFLFTFAIVDGIIENKQDEDDGILLFNFQPMLLSLKSHFSRKELYSLLHTFLAAFVGIIAVEAYSPFQVVMVGDLSQEAILALVGAVGRSAIKALFNIAVAMLKPKQENNPSLPIAPSQS